MLTAFPASVQTKSTQCATCSWTTWARMPNPSLSWSTRQSRPCWWKISCHTPGLSLLCAYHKALPEVFGAWLSPALPLPLVGVCVCVCVCECACEVACGRGRVRVYVSKKKNKHISICTFYYYNEREKECGREFTKLYTVDRPIVKRMKQKIEGLHCFSHFGSFLCVDLVWTRRISYITTH